MSTDAWSYTSGTSERAAARPHHRRPVRPDRRRFTPTTRRWCRATRVSATRTAQLRREVDRCARALMALGVAQGRAGRHLGAELRRVGDHPVRHGQARRDPREHQPELPAERAAVRAAPVRLLVARDRAAVQDLGLHGHAPRARAGARRSRAGALRAATLPDLRGVVRLGDEPSPGMLRWAELLAMADGVSADELARRQRQQEFDDPINIQYTSGTTGYPKGATLSHHNILNNGYFTTELLRFTDRDRLLIPVPLYHCFGMVHGQPRLRHPRRHHDLSRATASTRPAVLEAVAGRALHRALRRADHVHRRAEPSRLRAATISPALRTGIMAGSPCPVEVMKQVQAQMHMHEVTIAYGMTETSPVSTQTRIGDAAGQAGGHGGRRCIRTCEVKIVDPADRPGRAASASAASCARAATA